MAPCYFAGATIVLRQKFSASQFSKTFEITRSLASCASPPEGLFSSKSKIITTQQCTAAIYIGELWRCLQLLPESDQDQTHGLRVIVGNGLRPEVWEGVVNRFGIELVVEHYGSTEMPGDAVLNYFNKIGSCGYVPPSVWKGREAKVIRFDVEQETVIRDGVDFPFSLLFTT